MYDSILVIHKAFIYAGLEGINIISLAVLKIFSDFDLSKVPKLSSL